MNFLESPSNMSESDGISDRSMFKRKSVVVNKKSYLFMNSRKKSKLDIINNSFKDNTKKFEKRMTMNTQHIGSGIFNRTKSNDSKSSKSINPIELIKIKNKLRLSITELKYRLNLELTYEEMETMKEKFKGSEFKLSNSLINPNLDCEEKLSTPKNKSKEKTEFDQNTDNLEKFEKIKVEEIVDPFYKMEYNMNEKTKKTLSNLKVLVDLILAILDDCNNMYQKQSYMETEKLTASLKELKQYLKKLKLHVDNNKNSNINQLLGIEQNFAETILKCREKEKILTSVLLRELVVDSEYIKQFKEQKEREMQYENKFTNVEVQGESLKSTINALSLSVDRIISHTEISTFSFPHIMTSFSLFSSQRTYILWINSTFNYVEVLEIYLEDKLHSEDEHNTILEKDDDDNSINQTIDYLLKDNKRKENISEVRRFHFLKGHTGKINSVRSFCSKEHLAYNVITCTDEGSAKIWYLDKGKFVLFKNFEFGPNLSIFTSFYFFGSEKSKTGNNNNKTKEMSSSSLPNTKRTERVEKIKKVKPYSKDILIVGGFSRNFSIKFIDPKSNDIPNEINVKDACCYNLEIISFQNDKNKFGVISSVKHILCCSLLIKTKYFLNLYDFNTCSLIYSIPTDNYVNSIFLMNSNLEKEVVKRQKNDERKQSDILGLNIASDMISAKVSFDVENKDKDEPKTIIISDRNGKISIFDLSNGKMSYSIKGNGYYNLKKLNEKYLISCGKLSLLQVIGLNDFKVVKEYNYKELRNNIVSNDENDIFNSSLQNNSSNGTNIIHLEVVNYPGKNICILSLSEDKCINLWTSVFDDQDE